MVVLLFPINEKLEHFLSRNQLFYIVYSSYLLPLLKNFPHTITERKIYE